MQRTSTMSFHPPNDMMPASTSGQPLVCQEIYNPFTLVSGTQQDPTLVTNSGVRVAHGQEEQEEGQKTCRAQHFKRRQQTITRPVLHQRACRSHWNETYAAAAGLRGVRG